MKLVCRNRIGTRRRGGLDHRLGIDTGALHLFLRGIDVQRAWREVIDVRAVEAHHIGNQLMRLAQRAIGRQRHRGIAMPAEGFQRFGHELPCLIGIQPALLFVALDQLQGAGGKDLALLQDLLGLCAQGGVFDQFQPQQRGEHAKRICRQRRLVDRAECGGMHRHAGHRQVVIAHWLHAHHCEQPTQGRQFGRRADADGAVPFQIQPRALVVALQPLRQRRIGLQRLRVDLRHQRHQVAIQRHLGAIHVRHRLGEPAADLIGRQRRYRAWAGLGQVPAERQR